MADADDTVLLLIVIMRLQLENIFRHLADGGLLVLPGAQVLKTI